MQEANRSNWSQTWAETQARQARSKRSRAKASQPTPHLGNREPWQAAIYTLHVEAPGSHHSTFCYWLSECGGKRASSPTHPQDLGEQLRAKTWVDKINRQSSGLVDVLFAPFLSEFCTKATVAFHQPVQRSAKAVRPCSPFPEERKPSCTSFQAGQIAAEAPSLRTA